MVTMDEAGELHDTLLLKLLWLWFQLLARDDDDALMMAALLPGEVAAAAAVAPFSEWWWWWWWFNIIIDGLLIEDDIAEAADDDTLEHTDNLLCWSPLVISSGSVITSDVLCCGWRLWSLVEEGGNDVCLSLLLISTISSFTFSKHSPFSPSVEEESLWSEWTPDFLFLSKDRVRFFLLFTTASVSEK